LNIQEFFQETISALVRWHNVHYDRNSWIDKWVGVKDIEKYFETCNGTLSNGFFYFNWDYAARSREVRALQEECAVGASVVKDLMEGKWPIKPKYLWDSLYEEGFNAFADGCHEHTDKHKDEVLESLRQISDAGNLEEQMAAVMWALHIQHTNGCIAVDYSEKLSSHMVHVVQQYGLKAMFTPAEVEKFLRGEYPPLKVEGLREETK
jgi:hypothetical protein